MPNNTVVEPAKLTLRQVLSVRCPMCGAKPKEKCILSTGHPCKKTHHDRRLSAAKMSCPESFAQAALRILKKATSGLGVLFHNT
jgi:hypothetical protein